MFSVYTLIVFLEFLNYIFKCLLSVTWITIWVMAAKI